MSYKTFCLAATFFSALSPAFGDGRDRSNDIFLYDYDGTPEKIVYQEAGDMGNCFLVVSKVHPEHLSVYEAVGSDTLLLATYPACLSLNKGQKHCEGDKKTPESYPGTPFHISEIVDASSWAHDFGDGRGEILSYGAWFLRLNTPGHSGIGIHGSTNNEESILTGRDSEGCIRLHDIDIIHLREHYVAPGMKVIVLPEGHRPLPFEKTAYKNAGVDI